MASNLQNKSKQADGAETDSITEQKPADLSAISAASPFTPEQKQILGNVYRLILGWRRERLMKSKHASTSISPALLPVEREA